MALTVAELRAVFTADLGDLKRGEAQARQSMAGTAASMNQSMAGYHRDEAGRLRDSRGRYVAAGAAAGEGMARGVEGGARRARTSILGVDKSFLKLAGGIGIVGLLKSSSQLEQSFSQTMRTMAASTGATAGEVKSLTDLAMRMGAETSFSANDSAGAMLELAKAGISTSDIMGGALSGTLLLAAAGGTELGTAATIASNAMNTFSLKGDQMNMVASALAGGANASSASVESLGQALQQVGPGATNAGLSLNETVAVLSAFDAAGIKGSDAGTSLKTALVNLVPQTKKARDEMAALGLDFTKADGSFVSISNVAQQLQDKLGPLSEEQRTQALATLFGADAARAATVLMNEGAKGIDGYVAATKDQTAAQKMADAAMSGTSGAMERLGGAVETAQLALGQALAPTVVEVADWLSGRAVPAITDFIGGMQDGTGAGGEFADTMVTLADAGMSVVDAVKDLAPLGKGLLEMWSALPGPMQSAVVQMGAFSVAASKIRGFTGGLGLGSWITQMGDVERRAGATATAVGKLKSIGRTAGLAGGLLALTEGANSSNEALQGLSKVGGGALMGFGVAGPVGAAVGGLVGLLAALSSTTGDAADAAKESIGTWQEYADTLDQVTGAATEQTGKGVLKNLTDSGAIATLDKLGVSAKTAVDAVLGVPAARERVTAAIRTEETAIAGLVEKLDAEKAAYAANTEANGGIGDPAQAERIDALQKEIDLRNAVLDAIVENAGAAEDAVEKTQAEIAATRDLSEVLKTMPEDVRTKIETDGLLPTEDAIVDLVRDYDSLDGRQVRTLLQANGAEGTREEINRVFFAAGKIPPRIMTRVQQEGAERAQGTIAELINRYNLTPDLVRTLIRESGARPTQAAIDSVYAAARALDQQAPTVPVRAQNFASGIISTVTAALNRLDGKTATTFIKTVRQEERRSVAAGTNAASSGVGGPSPGGRRRARGGPVFGPGTGTSDDIDVRVSNGEFVVNADATSKNRGLLEAINSGAYRTRGYATGGYVSDEAPTTLELLEQRKEIADLERDLAERKKKRKGKGKKAKEVDDGPMLRGLEREVAEERLRQARAMLGQMQGWQPPAPAAADRSSIADALKSAFVGDLIGSSSSATATLRAMQKQAVTNDQWAKMLAQLSGAGLSDQLRDALFAKGPSTQSLRLGQDILRKGLVGQYNQTASALGMQGTQAAAYAAGTAGTPVAPVQIENFYAQEQTPAEIGERLNFLNRVRAGL